MKLSRSNREIHLIYLLRRGRKRAGFSHPDPTFFSFLLIIILQAESCKQWLFLETRASRAALPHHCQPAEEGSQLGSCHGTAAQKVKWEDRGSACRVTGCDACMVVGALGAELTGRDTHMHSL